MRFLIDHNLEGHSVEQVMREENTTQSLPVITIGNANRLLVDSEYRERCVEKLVEIAVDIDDYKGTRRMFIP